jgi:hypothetical protein
MDRFPSRRKHQKKESVNVSPDQQKLPICTTEIKARESRQSLRDPRDNIERSGVCVIGIKLKRKCVILKNVVQEIFAEDSSNLEKYIN